MLCHSYVQMLNNFANAKCISWVRWFLLDTYWNFISNGKGYAVSLKIICHVVKWQVTKFLGRKLWHAASAHMLFPKILTVIQWWLENIWQFIKLCGCSSELFYYMHISFGDQDKWYSFYQFLSTNLYSSYIIFIYNILHVKYHILVVQP